MDELGVGPRPTASRIYTYEPLPSVFPGPRPHGPHKPNLVSFTSTFASIFTNITGKFADNLGIGLHVI